MFPRFRVDVSPVLLRSLAPVKGNVRWKIPVILSNWSLLALAFICGTLTATIASVMQPFGLSRLASALVGFAFVVLATFLAVAFRQISIKKLVGSFVGMFAGSALGLIFVVISSFTAVIPTQSVGFIRLCVPLLMGYMGLLVGLTKGGDLSFGVSSLPAEVALLNSGKVLDTSVLIDGRITDIVESGFLEGPLVIPRFVLHELQVVADSADSARRARGRRGLDVVKRLQALPDLKIEVSQQDFPATREVDLKLIEFAKLRAVKIVTNDFNLNKLAQVQGIRVLNINELANSLKPVVLPGESMRVLILKEGKEHNQGIAYLDDGTMVVVDNARRMMSKQIDIVVTSVLQTTAGKMIFGRYDERSQAEARPYSATASS